MDTPNISGIESAVRAGQESAEIERRYSKVEGIPIALVPQSMRIDVLTKVLDEAEKRAETPRRRKGTAAHEEVDSFIAHVNRFKDAGSVVFAEPSKTRLVAILDYHHAGHDSAPRWGEHRSVYSCPLSKQWQAWTSRDGRDMTQDQFGEFIDANMVDLASARADEKDFAQPADVLLMARNLTIRTKGEFTRSINPTTGEGTLISKLENDAQSTKIPRSFLLGIPVFEGGEVYRVEARVRFQMRDGKPVFAYSLVQPEAIVRDAFGSVRKRVASETSLPVFAGTPE